VSARAAASAGDNVTDAWRAVAPTLAAKPDASVLIVGGTPSVGVFVAMHAAALGSGRVLYVGPDSARRGLVTTLAVETRTGLPEPGEAEFDLVVDAGARRPTTRRLARAGGAGGRCHSVGIYFGDRTAMPLETMFMNGTTFTTSRPDVGHSIPQVLDLLATGAIDPLPVYSHEVAWDDAPIALAESPDKPIVERERLLTSPR
jgi:alcohol dehydrogenase